MKSAIEMIGWDVALPAAISFAVSFALTRLLPADLARRHSMGLAVCVGYCTGYILLRSSADLVPTRNWQWTFYLVMAAAVIGAAAAGNGIWLFERWLLYLLVAAIAAWLLVPNRTTLQPPRSTWLWMLTAYLTVLATLLDPLIRRIGDGPPLAAMVLSASGVAAIVAYYYSLTDARVAGVAAGAMAGCWIASWLLSTSGAGAVSLVYSVLIGALAFNGTVGPARPLFGLLLVPIAPLALWLFVAGPLAKLTGRTAVVLQMGAVLAVIGVGVGLIAGVAGL